MARIVAGFSELSPQPDAAPAIRAAVAAGLRVFTLSNGAAPTIREFLGRAGVAADVVAILSIDDVRAWKPAPAAYRHAVATAGVPSKRVALVAVHSWDLHGARQASLTAVRAPRLEGAPTPLFGAADVRGDTLDNVIQALATLPARR